MMSNRGGIATLSGIKYEIKVVLYEIPRLLRGEIKHLRYQPLSSAIDTKQKPTKIFADDLAILFSDGQSCYCQAKRNAADANWTIRRLIDEGVIQQFVEQNRTTPDSKLRFTSNITAVPLVNAAAYARQATSVDEFTTHWNREIEASCTCMIERLKTLDICLPELWELLQQVECELLPENVVDRVIGDYAFENYQDPDKFLGVLKNLIENNPSAIIDGERVSTALEEKGLYPLSRKSEVDIQTEFARASGPLKVYRSEIHGVHIERQETDDLSERIRESGANNRIAFLVDAAGSGKSVIMKDLLEKLEAEHIPALAIKADTLGSITNEGQLQKALNLSDSPEAMLSVTSTNNTTVLLVDQLDALSQTFARNQDCLDLMIRLIARASRIRGVSVVVSCRDFDRKFDPKLRQVESQEFTIKPLEQSQIERVLEKIDIKWDVLTSCEQELLTNPQHLLSYAEVVVEKNLRGEQINSYSTIQDVYHELWNLKIEHPGSCPVAYKELQSTVYRLVDAIHSTQLLNQPVSVLGSSLQAMAYLQSVGIISIENGKVGFFHQSFFDYCYARRFVEQNASLADLIRSRDQGFFVRAEMVQTLTYLRGTDEQRYLKELQSLMANNAERQLRYHLRSLLFAWFGQQKNLTKSEQIIGLRCMKADPCRRLFLGGASGNVEWFDVILPYLDQLLQLSDAEIDPIIAFLISVQNQRANDVFEGIKPKLNTSPAWNQRIRRCLALYEPWDSEPARELLIRFCRTVPNFSESVNLIMRHIIKEDVGFACKVFGIILNRSFEEWSLIERPKKDDLSDFALDEKDEDSTKQIAAYSRASNDFEKHARKLIPSQTYWIKELAAKASADCPKLFVAAVLPWLKKCLPKLVWHKDADGWERDVIFIWAFSGTGIHETSTFIIEGLTKSLENIAEHDKERFVSQAREISETPHLVLHQILIRVLVHKAEEYASWACQYLLADPMRFDTPEEVCGGNISRKLIASIFPHLSLKERQALEKAILEYCPEWESRPDCLKFRGSGQHDLLHGIPDSLLSQKALTWKRQLQRKFSNRKPSEPRRSEFTAVGSPIPQDKCEILTDDAWLKAMKHFDDSTGWDQPREHFLKGGVVELSRAFKEVVKKNPEQYITLVKRFDESISSAYFSAFLDGFEESGIDTEKVFDECRKMISLRGSDTVVQTSICQTLRKRAEHCPSVDLIEYLRQVALTSPDPDRELWREKSQSGDRYYAGDPLSHGINTVRGTAVISYAMCVRSNKSYDNEVFLKTLEEIASDDSSAVRACLIDILPYVLNFCRNRVVRIFERAIAHRRELLESRVCYDFIYYSIHSHSKEMLKQIKSLAKSNVEEKCEWAGRLATLVFFENDDARAIMQSHMKNWRIIGRAILQILTTIISFHAPKVMIIFRDQMNRARAFRKGMATVFARNVENHILLSKCLRGLSKLRRKDDVEVLDSIGGVFKHLPPPDSNEIISFINKFITTDFSRRTSERLLKYAVKNCLLHYDFALEIGEKIFHKFAKSESVSQEFYWQIDEDMINLVILVYNHSNDLTLRSRAMDLFDQVMETGSDQARSLLKSLDR